MAPLRSREPSRLFYTLIYSDSSNAMAIQGNISDATDNPRVRKATLRVVNTDGTVDYYDESSAEECNDWKRKIGRYAARFALRPSEVVDRGQCVLLDFPEGYKLYSHKKGHKDDHRTDHYLIGSKHVRQFRSPAEFFLHFHWLIAGMPLDADGHPDCRCTYCSGIPQGKISQMFSNYHVRRPVDREDFIASKVARGRRKMVAEAGVKKRRVKTTIRPAPAPIQFKDYTKLAHDSQ